MGKNYRFLSMEVGEDCFQQIGSTTHLGYIFLGGSNAF